MPRNQNINLEEVAELKERTLEAYKRRLNGSDEQLLKRGTITRDDLLFLTYYTEALVLARNYLLESGKIADDCGRAELPGDQPWESTKIVEFHKGTPKTWETERQRAMAFLAGAIYTRRTVATLEDRYRVLAHIYEA